MFVHMSSSQPGPTVVLGGDPDLNALVFEALDKVAAPEARDAVIELALELAGADSQPAGIESLVSFVSGPLQQAAMDSLGAAAADAFVDDVKPVLDRVVRLRNSTPPPPTTIPPSSLPPSHGEMTALRIPHAPRPVHMTLPPTGLFRGQDAPGVQPAEDPSGAALKRRMTLPYMQAEEARGFVLLVDDDPQFLRGFSRLLRLAGYDVVAAADARAALRLCHRLHPTLVISDYEMPETDGMQLAQQIAQTMGEAAPPVLLLTGMSDPPKPPAAVLRVLLKSIRPDELLAEIEPLLCFEPAQKPAQ